MATGLLGLLERSFGKKHRDLARLRPMVELVKAAREPLAALTDDQLRAKRVEFKARLAAGETVDDLMPEAFGVVWEGCRRLAERKASWPVWGRESTWNMVPYDVQILGAVVLHQGKIAEMATGEGKTLVAIMPLYLNSLPGLGAHLVTVNDYLARRDAEWMGGVLTFLGCDVKFILNEMTPDQRREAYAAEITYGTNNEFGFDYLRDNMAIATEHLVQRGFHYAIVDEVDSVLIDEARTPLIISGAVAKSTHRFNELKPRVDRLVRAQLKIVNQWIADCERAMHGAEEKEVTLDDATKLKLLRISRGAPKNKRFQRLKLIPGVAETIQRTEENFMRDKAMWEADEDLLYVVEEKHNSVDLTEKGRSLLAEGDHDFFVLPDLAALGSDLEVDESLTPAQKAEKLAAAEQLYATKNEQISNVDQLLRAYSLYEKDDEYVIQDGKIVIVDEFTGRLMPGRRFSEGLHQALEAKEGVTVERETQTLATITIQNFFRMYMKLAGMTGTAETEEAEFNSIYDLDVVVIPTNRPVARVEYDDVIYLTKKEKYKAIIDEVARLHHLGLPVLVGTTTVEVSELLSRLLRLQGINHSVLNAKHHKNEAEIVAGAGRIGAVTIATNMAGRGTDIKLDPDLGSLPARWAQDGALKRDDWEDEPLGLHIIGTERHESRRIDRQLRGRAGRQGDPGSAIFFLSLEDDLMRLFGHERMNRVLGSLGVQENEAITHSMVTKAIEKAQIRVENHNFDIRKHLLEYDDVVNKQREVIYSQRREILVEQDVHDVLDDFLGGAIDTLVDEHCRADQPPDDWRIDDLARQYQGLVLAPLPLAKDEHLELGLDALRDRLLDHAGQHRRQKEERLGADLCRQLERYVLLNVIDQRWRDHLNELIMLRSGIGLRSFGQRNPLIEYKRESFELFEQLMDGIRRDSASLFFRAELVRTPPQPRPPDPAALRAQHQAVNAYERTAQPATTGGGAAAESVTRAGRTQPIRHDGPKVGRNDPCPCGSGKKYKQCCGR
ncbi:MAG TPA: preprotein translocase subunit SecA [Candidatus Krumholzibacteria bacterium]|nr:preprotein translocase subunit SecA [Candidatus Krumholzibacteria bacterium]HPD71591.1 preprotein translocase subunit SecA [Candidatus Krumholzibacteria bacterium]HRY41476.1 preprotein translocase subunit SecA [Candidatus Krumholzibacteria bacterium]